jgi:hypothetical protein
MTEIPRVVLGGQFYAIERSCGHAGSNFGPAQISQVAVDSRGFVLVLRGGLPPFAVFTPQARLPIPLERGRFSIRTAFPSTRATALGSLTAARIGFILSPATTRG